jgi:hypothetical protein
MAQAEYGRTYGQIVSNILQLIFTKDVLHEWNPDHIEVIDITDMSPLPQVGWVFDGAEFSATVPTVSDYISAMEKHYDSVARVKKYDNRYTCALRAGYAGPFQIEGQTFSIWMDSCNAYGYQVMEDVQSGHRAMPTMADLLAELPVAPW